MSIFSKSLDIVSLEHSWQTEEQEWQASGVVPDDFQRVYPNEHAYEKDEVRLEAMGYRPVGRDTVRSAEIGMFRVRGKTSASHVSAQL